MTTAEQIKATITMADVLSRYGYETNSKGYMKCPFHAAGQEKTPSFHVKGNNFTCYGCNASGSVIDFVMQMFAINFSQAIVRLNYDFNLGLTGEKPDARKVAKIGQERIQAKKAIYDYRAEYMDNILQFKGMLELAREFKPKQGQHPRPIYFLAISQMEYLNYWFRENAWK